MKWNWLAVWVGGLGLAAALGFTPNGQLTASDIAWKGFTGQRGADGQNLYVLMARGFMGLPGLSIPDFPEELDAEIAGWIEEHPQASVIPIRRMPLSEEFFFLHVWLVDGGDNLNLDLVRRGLCAAEQMVVPPLQEILIEKPRYEQFRLAVLHAEQLAIENKLGIWAKPGMEGRAHWRRAEFLEEQGDLEHAIEEFEAAARFGDGRASSAWYRIGKLHERLGRPDAAAQAFDRSIATATHDTEARSARIEKARLLARQGGADATREVFGDLESQCVDDLARCMDAAAASTDPVGSVEILEAPLLAFLGRHEIAFEGDSLRFDAKKVKRSNKYWRALHEAAVGYEALAVYCLAAGDVEGALHHAAKVISIKQNTWGALAETLDPLTMEAASFEARLVRGQAFTAKRMFDEAKRELDHAKVLVDTSQVQGGFLNERLEHAYAELKTAFPERQVDIPAKYEPAARPKPRKYTPAVLHGMEEDELVSLAAGADHAASFAALEELVGRHRRGPLSEDTKEKLVADGLAHLSGLKAQPFSLRTQSTGWRAQYGVFIEDALEQGKLSKEDRARYLENMLGISIDFGRVEVAGSPPLHFALHTEPRVASSLAERGSSKARWTATIRAEGGLIDGKPVRVTMPGEDNVETMALMGVVMTGFGCVASDFEPLIPGSHVLTVQGQLEIREGDLGVRTTSEDLAKIQTVSRRPFSVSAEFEVEK